MIEFIITIILALSMSISSKYSMRGDNIMKKTIIKIIVIVALILLGIGLGFLIYTLTNMVSYDDLQSFTNQSYELDFSVVTDSGEVNYNGNYDKDTNTLTFTNMNDETATVNGNLYAEILPSLQGIKLKKYQTYLKDLSFVSLPTFKELIKVDEFTLNQNNSTCEFTINDSFIENIYCETDTQVVNISFVNIE